MITNVGIVSTWFERGAAYVSKQYRQLLSAEFNVFVYGRGGERYGQGEASWDHHGVTWAKRSLIPVVTAIDRNDFLRWIRQNKIEFVLFNEQAWWIPLIWCRQIGVKTCAYVDYYTEETVPLFAAYDVLLCNTKRHFDVFRWHPGAVYMPWGTDIHLFEPTCIGAVNPGLITFFHSAGMSPYRKGTDLLLAAFDMLLPPKRLIIHSQVPLKAVLPTVGPLLDKLLVSGELHVVEATVPAPGLYHLGDVYVYPSRLEGIGLTIAEAISCGLPAIVPDNPPMNEFVTSEVGRRVSIEKLFARADGYYWPQCEVSVQSLAQSMQWYVDRPEEIAAHKSLARHFACRQLDWRCNRGELVQSVLGIRGSTDVSSKIRAYELKRAEGNFRLKMYMKHPLLYKAEEALRKIRSIANGR